jgi:hypothetical protein
VGKSRVPQLMAYRTASRDFAHAVKNGPPVGQGEHRRSTVRANSLLYAMRLCPPTATTSKMIEVAGTKPGHDPVGCCVAELYF